MFSTVSKKLKIFYSIILAIFVNMMNDFFWLKESFKVFFHNQTMFKNISPAIRKRMLRFPDNKITCNSFNFPASPVVIFLSNITNAHPFSSFTSPNFAFLNESHLFSGLNRNWSLIKTFSGTKLCTIFNATWTNVKYLIAYLARSFYLFSICFIAAIIRTIDTPKKTVKNLEFFLAKGTFFNKLHILNYNIDKGYCNGL